MFKLGISHYEGTPLSNKKVLWTTLVVVCRELTAVYRTNGKKYSFGISILWGYLLCRLKPRSVCERMLTSHSRYEIEFHCNLYKNKMLEKKLNFTTFRNVPTILSSCFIFYVR